MSKNKVIGNTIDFIFILLVINLFVFLFGKENQIVGVAIVTSAYAFLQRDLTAAPLKNLLWLVTINVATGICSSLSTINPFLGVAINILIIFLLIYIFSSNFKASLVVPIGFQYLFMLYDPVYGKDLVVRLVSLVFGAFFIMGMQFVSNKTRVKKTLSKSLLKIIESFLVHLESEDNKGTEIQSEINSIKKVMYESRKDKFFFSQNSKKLTNIVYLLEKLNIEIMNDKLNDNKDENLIQSLNLIRRGLKKQSVEEIDVLKIDNICLVNIANELINLSKDSNNNEVIRGTIPEYLTSKKIFMDNLKGRTLKFSYAIRQTIMLSSAIFIVDILNLEEGRWAIYTMFSVMQPYYEVSKSRAKDRVIGTLIGAVIVVLCFVIIKDSMLRGMIVLGAGYLNPFATSYTNLMMAVTVSVLAKMGLEGGLLFFISERILFVVAGALIALLASKYILKFNLEDGANEIKENYKKIIQKMSFEINGKISEEGLNSLYLMVGFLEDKIKSINSVEDYNKKYYDFFENNREKVNSLYGDYYRLKVEEKL
ncbi:MAG: FUSC family protein [Sarcina sp.]